MKRAALLTFVVFFVAGSLMPQSPSSAAPPTPDGEWWRHASLANKYWFVRGVRDGMAFLAGMQQSSCETVGATAKLYYDSCSAENVVEGLDQIYSDPTNARVPVIIGIRAHVMRVNGDPAANVEELLREARKSWNR
jgi:hypothetical protein